MKYPSNYFKQPKNIFFCDVETTGLDNWRNEILTLSMSVLSYSTLRVKDEIELRFRPSNLEYWQQEAEDVHKISIAEAMQFSNKNESSQKLKEFIFDYGDHNAFCCHALKFKSYFDWLFLRTHFAKLGLEFELNKKVNKTESTIDFYKHAVKEQKISLDNFKLNTICEKFNVALDHHDAKSDRVACEKIYVIARGL